MGREPGDRALVRRTQRRESERRDLVLGTMIDVSLCAVSSQQTTSTIRQHASENKDKAGVRRT
jgi:hypothetical protein